LDQRAGRDPLRLRLRITRREHFRPAGSRAPPVPSVRPIRHREGAPTDKSLRRLRKFRVGHAQTGSPQRSLRFTEARGRKPQMDANGRRWAETRSPSPRTGEPCFHGHTLSICVHWRPSAVKGNRPLGRRGLTAALLRWHLCCRRNQPRKVACYGRRCAVPRSPFSAVVPRPSLRLPGGSGCAALGNLPAGSPKASQNATNVADLSHELLRFDSLPS
jgi:hypothetical protein